MNKGENLCFLGDKQLWESAHAVMDFREVVECSYQENISYFTLKQEMFLIFI
ncbi:hypothetical protein RV09_GL003118 [Enterococcus moraviensis]|nr:hypothetical protein RV09_GL003118 [Enterococcus moraviensis]